MNGRIPLLCCILFLISLCLSFRWPLDDGEITSTFGESREDHFHDGVDMVSRDDRVYPAAPGNLAYMWDKSMFPLDNYPGGGNYRIVRHDDNLFSLYLHLSDSPRFTYRYEETMPIGIVGDTGHSYGRHIHFTFINLTEGKSFNPLRLLPGIGDSLSPKIGDAYIRIGDKYTMIRDNANIRLTRHYPLLLNISDAMEKKENLGIYRLVVDFNGEKVLEINFSEIADSKKELTICGKKFHDMYDEKGYYKIDPVKYIDGLNRLKIMACDYSSNESVKELSFNVKLDM